jgi:hypothetical protein
MNIKELSSKTKIYIVDLVDNLAQTNFMISIARPAINMAIENNFYKVNNLFDIIADKEGNIDIEKLIDDTISSVLNGRKGVLPVGKICQIQFGDNNMKVEIPSLNYYISFNSDDFIKFKNYLIGNGTQTLH